MPVTIKLASGAQHQVEVSDFNVTVGDLKKQVADTLEIPADEQRIILRGKVLKDDGVLSAVGMEDGSVIHVVRSKKVAPPVSATAPSSAPAVSNSTPPVTASPQATPSAPTAPSAAVNPYASLMSNFGATQTQQPAGAASGFPAAGNPFASMGMGMGMGAGAGRGVGAAEGMTPQQAMGMMQNPMMQQMMQQALNDPNFMQYVVQSSPELSAMAPEQQRAIIEMMRNPYMMQQAMSMMGGLGGAEGMTMPPLPTTAAPPAGAGFNPALFAPPVPQGNPREIYREQLQQLRDMGFPNEDANIAALQQAQGNVQFALERLLGA
ncbi:ubiquitin-like protein [Novymonas esmeraldas]|uniref:Ubiquitin-like protein n=1 Tax=Novymonas esmeraldas TaxID=1808958 RepID=A0AAW0ETH9_9TRYP